MATSRKMHWYTVPLIFFFIHLFLVGMTEVLILESDDPETEMIWCAFYFIDYPIAKLIFDPPPQLTSSLSAIPLRIFALGSIQWFGVGLMIEFVIRMLSGWRSSKQ